jgi:hypothetical protein
MSALASVGAAVSAAVGALGGGGCSNLENGNSNNANASATTNDKNIGILAMEVYTPSTYITQADLEEHSGVSKGKYTIGLGQEGLGICGDAEDVNSLALTVVHSLLEK